MSMLLDALGYAGDLFDKPGRAARSLVHGLTGGNFDDALAFIPGSDTFGLTDKANRVSGNDIWGAEDDGSILSTIRGMGTEMALDPLMLAGGVAGRMLGGRASEAAVARGPRYETTADDIARMAKQFDAGGHTGRPGGIMNQVKATDDMSERLSSRLADDYGKSLPAVSGNKYGLQGGRQFNPDKLENQFGNEARAEYDAATQGARRTPEEWSAIADDPVRVKNAMELESGTIGAANRNAIADAIRSSRGGLDNGQNATDGIFGGFMGGDDPALLNRLRSEIPPNSKMIGTGQEAIAFRSPSGEVIRVQPLIGGTPGRPVSEGILQPNSTIDLGMPYRVERTPFAENVGDKAYWHKRDPNTMLTKLDELDQTLAASNLNMDDRILGNVGTHGGKPVVIDPGAVKVKRQTVGPISFDLPIEEFRRKLAEERRLAALPDPVIARSPVTEASDPGRLMTALLNSIGSDDAVRRAYASGLSGPSFGRKLGAYGAAGGADAGILARMLAGE